MNDLRTGSQQNPVIRAFLLLFVTAATSCSGANFRSGSSQAPPDTNVNSGGTNKNQSAANASRPGSPPSGDNVSGDQNSKKSQTARFQYGPRWTQNDVLFVIDNSSSMNPFIELVKSGFESLAAATWFGDSRIAVMTTMPGDFANLNTVHPDVSPYPGIEFEPGFLSLVSASAFRTYQTVGGPSYRYPLSLCESEWFRPSDVNLSGHRCLSAALQNPFHSVNCEAGMTALSQIHDKRGKLFRDGAFAQIIFVSDAQDPGCHKPNLLSARPSGQALQEKIKQKNRISGLRFHGVLTIPGGGITNETRGNSDFGFPYNQLVTTTGGLLLDITSSRDYSAFAAAVAGSQLPEPSFPLPQRASKILSIRVSGQAIDLQRSTLDSGGMSVRIRGLAPTTDVDIAIEYAP